MWADFTAGGFKLELATLSEAEPIAIMARDLIESGLGWSWVPSQVAKYIRSSESLVIITRDQRNLVGFAIMNFSHNKAHLNLIGVKPSYQRGGIGRGLVEFLERSAWFAGISMIQLEIRANNQEARNFYQSLGYSEVGYFPKYYRGKENAVRMTHHLRETFWPLITSANDNTT